MRTSPVGNNAAAGVTLMELLVVMAIIGLIAGISFPSVSAGIDSVRLTTATDSIATFLNGAMNFAERRRQAVELVISRKENAMWLYSNDPGFQRKLAMPEGVVIQAVLPPAAEETEGPRRFVLMPGGTVPRIGVQVVNRRGVARIVRVDPMTGFPRVENVGAK